MDAAYSKAASAYANNFKLDTGLDTGAAEDKAAKPSFGETLGNALQDAVNTQYKTEGAKVESLTGRHDLTDLVTAVSNAELTLNTVVAVRDRVIAAYQDILRMPI